MTYDPYPGGGGPGGYQPYPGDAQMPPAQRGSAPPSVINAVRLMYAGAVISLIVLIINLITTKVSTLEANLRSQNSSSNLTAAQVSSIAHIEFVIVIVFGLLAVALWVWMARKSQAGRNWSRIVGTVFFGIFTVLLLLSFSRSVGSGIGLILDVILWLVGLGTVTLLWRKDSSAFFKPSQYQQNASWQA